MSYSEFEMIEPTYFKKNRTELRERLLKRFDPKRAVEEAVKVLREIRKYEPQVVEMPKDLPPTYLIKADKKAVIFVIVYPERYIIYTSDALKVINYLVDEYVAEKDIEEYIVLIFYSRKGKLGPAAYLYLGTVIETRDVGVLFINGDPEEVVEVIEKLRSEGRYEPEEEMSVKLS